MSVANLTSRFSLSSSYAALLPLWALIIFTPWSSSLDQFVTGLFYTQGHFVSSPLFDFIYQYGLYPAWAFVIASLAILFLAPLISCLRPWRHIALFFILILAIGSGLIIHAFLKDHWGRPRPRQVIEYGGHQPFLPYYKPNFMHQPEPSKSFPCGHCSMGFYFFGLALVGRFYKRPFLSYLGFALAWGLGGALGFVRIAQGGHFLSDVLVSGLIMWWTALGLFHCLFKEKLS